MSIFTSGFNGEYRRRPVINIGGFSKRESKKDLLSRVSGERESRELHRLQNISALKIQSLWRGGNVRQKEKNRVRKSFKEKMDCLAKFNSESKLNDFNSLLNQFIFFFDVRVDEEILCWMTEVFVKFKNEIFITISKRNWSRGLRLYFSVLGSGKYQTTDDRLLKSTLDFIELFFSVHPFGENSLRAFIESEIKIIFFGLQQLTNTLLPSQESSNRLLNLLQRPLLLLSPEKLSFSTFLVRQYCESFFTTPFSELLVSAIIPSLSQFFSTFPYFILSLSENPLTPSPWLLYVFLYFNKKINLASLKNIEFLQYLHILSHLSSCLKRNTRNVKEKDRVENEDEVMESETEDEEEKEIQEIQKINSLEITVLDSILQSFHENEWVNQILSLVIERSHDEPSLLKALIQFLYVLNNFDSEALTSYRLLYSLAFKPHILRTLWTLILDSQQCSVLESPESLITMISRGIALSSKEREDIIPLLQIFSTLFNYLLVTIHDTEFYGDEDNDKRKRKGSYTIWMPFSLSELVHMSHICKELGVGMIELSYPDSRSREIPSYFEKEDSKVWTNVLSKIVSLLRQFYNRDTRRGFCPQNHWISDRITLHKDKVSEVSFRSSRRVSFETLRIFKKEELGENEELPLSTKEIRLATVLREIPFVISFTQRLILFSNLIADDKKTHQGYGVHFLSGPSINLYIRRNFLYEDAFDKCNPNNEPNLKLKMRVELVNAVGLNEAGIDGGGLFREFLNELLKTSFDPNRGFFRLTRKNELYPNPNVSDIMADYLPHYYFIGRILGKALYENMLVELPLAAFFLLKLLGQQSLNGDIDHLQSLDPELYKNLLYLKTYEGNVMDLGLDFTVVNEEIGVTKLEELKSNGASILVTNDNRIEYIHLIADYKLNKQIRLQCNAFRQGLSDVINLDWIQMFSYRELQLCISGSEVQIDLKDLKSHTNYGGGYSKDHPTIRLFWKVLESFQENQIRSLLKFVTSCSRPPLLGFKELDPPFCIQHGGGELNRLPSASTCMNLLKLPDFDNENSLRDKLLYAIESGAGFELS